MENGSRQCQDDRVFKLIQLCHHETEKCIDTVMTFTELSSSTVDFALVRPLTTLLAKTRHPGLLYALLVVRQSWLNAAEENLAFQGVNITRATLCEMLATKCLSLYPPRSHALATALTSYHNPFSGATADLFDSSARPSQDELDDMLEEGDRFGNSALELSIETSAKRFIRCAPVQQFIDDLYNGEVIYRPSSQHSLISDDYKSDAVVEPYDFARTGLLDHYALRIPRIRRLLDFGTVLMLVFLFVTVQRVRHIERIEAAEIVFIIFAFGFAMEEAASIKERGFATYTSQIWNMLDMGFLCTFFVYFALRLVGLAYHSISLSTLSFDVLAIGACFLFPRVCSMLLTDSVVMIGLRAMLADYMAFLFFAVLCSFGFYLAFVILGKGAIPAGQLAWMMVKVFLGNSYVGFEIAPILHPQLGPALMLVYAVFSGTLLVTILISILSNTFSNVTVNVVDEALFQKAVTTLDMVKGDALSEHCVPMNLVALPVLLPASLFLSSRHFHRLNVFVIRATHFPILMTIHLYYRLTRRADDGKVHLHDKESSDIWQSFSGLRRTVIADRLFERPVTKAGRTLDRIDSRDASTHPHRSVPPLAIRGSGGQRALSMQSEDSTSSSYGTSAQPSGMLAQLFGGTFTSRSSSQDSQTSPPSDEKYAALEAKLDKIEEMVSRLVTGGLSLENNDR